MAAPDFKNGKLQLISGFSVSDRVSMSCWLNITDPALLPFLLEFLLALLVVLDLIHPIRMMIFPVVCIHQRGLVVLVRHHEVEVLVLVGL